ncbi:MAG: glutamine--fructose-6-phosphate transaminase (isomerizing) [Candidatus Omnitrophica bacterium]|nr:glutamine--fructose-6-phosphate transaminase (isomerizing) [Candidatus Omnitrophota bacterium]HOX54925.1 glutamine--fructose-6-phosphate transaminase (isomerizing) [Candidatus Omnitrophota bacterium]
MCGIVGYIGEKDAQTILIDGLKRLEYRGYDSSGIGVILNKQIHIRKRQGKIKDLEQLLAKAPLASSHVGIAHTRWATHGAPNQVNAHPHCDCKNKICLVHNGIIENYQQLKNELKKQGHKFRSETDTEMIAHLIEGFYKGDLLKAVRLAAKRLQGSFALGVISADNPDELVACRKDSPLIIALGKGEKFIASDVPAILEYSNEVIYLNDNEVALLTKDNVGIFDLKGKKIKKTVTNITFDITSAQKDGRPHFMLKEIFEQPKVAAKIISSRIKGSRIHFDELKIKESSLRDIKHIIIIACGTAYHAGLVGKYLIEDLTGISVTVDLSSEFRYRKMIIPKDAIIIAISQSGETADTLAAVRLAKQRGIKILSICNVVGSSLVRESDGVIYTYAGPEIGVASTKAYTAQLAILYLFGLYLADLTKAASRQEINKYLTQFRKVPGMQQKILDNEKSIMQVAARHHHFGSFLYLGRNINFPTALEGALKLKEISYIPAEGYAGGEMKHGPIALIDEYRAVVCIATASKIYDKMVSNIHEIRARAGKIIAIASQGDKEIRNYVKEVIFSPMIEDLFSPLLNVVILQLLAYHIAVRRGCNVDQPRNLAKSVTVE